MPGYIVTSTAEGFSARRVCERFGRSAPRGRHASRKSEGTRPTSSVNHARACWRADRVDPYLEEVAMPAQLDHLILVVNDRRASVDFYTQVLGFAYEGDREPFAMIRVNPGLVLQLAAWGTTGGTHLAFAMPRADFDATFARIRAAGIPYGDSFHDVGNMRGPDDEAGARGPGKAVYAFDPNKHLVEIRHYAA